MATPETQENQTQEQQEAQAQQTTEDRTKLETSVKAKLAAVFGDKDETPEPDEAVEPEASGEPETEEETGSDTASEPESEDTVEEAAAESHDDSNAPTLPEAYRRSLKAYDWTDEDIDRNLTALGSDFIRTASRIHENRNAELARFAQAGRAQREQQAPARTESTSQAVASDSRLPQPLKPIDVDKIMENYGDDDGLRELLIQSNATVAAVNALIPALQQGVQATEAAEAERAHREVSTFFADKTLAPYAELYGAPDKQLTTEQLKVRNELLDTAYDLIVGAQQLRGEAVPIHVALMQAHGMVSRDFDQNRTRQSVKKVAKERNRGISLKPTRRTGASINTTGQPKTRAELEAQTRTKLNTIFSR